MAQECTLIYETGLPIPFTVADGTAIEKGAILKLGDNMSGAISDGDGDAVAGIAGSEKIASDGNTKLDVYRQGIFRGYASGAIVFGAALTTGASTTANDILSAPVGAENLLGTALESCEDGNTFLFELNPRGVNLA